MLNSSRAPKPKIAGVDFGDGLFVIARDKILCTAKGSNVHITIHSGPRSKVLDFHLTSRIAGEVHHQPLFNIRHRNLEEMMQEILFPIAKHLLRAFRRLRPSWLARNRIGVILGSFPIKRSDLEAESTVHKRKLIIDDEKLQNKLRIPEFLEDLYGLRLGRLHTYLIWNEKPKEANYRNRI